MTESKTCSSLIKIKLDDVNENSMTRREASGHNDLHYNHDYSSNDDSSSMNNIKKNRYGKESRSYECQVEDCKKSFKDKGAYRKHQLTHGEKLYPCDNCGKKFLDNSKLRRHSLVHTGEKPFRCTFCEKRFSLDFNLRTHLRIHSGEKPYACIFPGCFKRFSQSSNLSAHEKTHQNPKQNEGNPYIEINQTQRPIFAENPLKYMIDNEFSGTNSLNNIYHINILCELMKKGVNQQNALPPYGYQANPSISSMNTSAPSIQLHSNVFFTTSTNTNPNTNTNNSNPQGKMKLFVTTKGKRVFDIIKDGTPQPQASTSSLMNLGGAAAAGTGPAQKYYNNSTPMTSTMYSNYQSNQTISMLDNDKQAYLMNHNNERNKNVNPVGMMNGNQHINEEQQLIENVPQEEFQEEEVLEENKEEDFYAIHDWEASFK